MRHDETAAGRVSAEAVARTRGRILLVLVLLTLAGAAFRLCFFKAYTLEGTDCDGAGYMNLARNIAWGEGWVTNSLRFLFLLPPALPQADAHWSPLYPLLTSLSYAGFGTSFAAAKLVPLLFGSLVPGAVFALGAGLTRSWRAGLVAGWLAVFHPTLVTWSLRIETEIASVFFTAATLALLCHPRTTARSYWVGIALGLAYLTKYQSIVLWAPVMLFYFLDTPWRTAVKRMAMAAAAFVVVILPWLVRNALAFGDPFYTDLRYNVISYYPEFRGEPRYLTSLTMPAGTLEYMSTHVVTVLKFAKANLESLASGFFRQNAGSVLLVPLALVGLPGVLSAWRRWVPVALFALLLVGLISISIPQVRYLHVLVPFWIVLAAAGVARLAERTAGKRVLVGLVWLLVSAAVLDETRTVVKTARDTSGEWTPSANFCALEAAVASDYIRSHSAPSDPVFAPETFHYALILDRNVIQLPFDEGDLFRLARRYGARYVVTTTRDLRERLPSWEEHPPGLLVLRVPADRIPRPAANPGYAHVSDVLVFLLPIGPAIEYLPGRYGMR